MVKIGNERLYTESEILEKLKDRYGKDRRNIDYLPDMITTLSYAFDRDTKYILNAIGHPMTSDEIDDKMFKDAGY